MELIISLSSPPTIARRCKTFSHDNSLKPIKPTTKIINFSNFTSKTPILPMGLFGKRRLSKRLLHGQHNLNSVRVFAQSESAGFDPLLAKAQDQSADRDSIFSKVLRFGSGCYKLARPMALGHAALSFTCLFARVLLVENPQLFTWSRLLKAFPGLMAMLLAHGYYIGLNEIYDADIDRVNKPYLPIPAGDISLSQAWLLVILEALAGLLIVLSMKADLITISIYCIGLFCGTAYSAPPLRLKRNSVTASTVLGLISVLKSVGVIYASRASLGLPFLWSPPDVFIVTFAALFFFALATIKDITDIEGDLQHNIRTFAAIFGPKNIAIFCNGILLMNYIGAMAAAIFMPQAFKSYIMLPAHFLLALWLLFRFKKLDEQNYGKEAGRSFIAFMFKLLTWEYLLFLVI